MTRKAIQITPGMLIEDLVAACPDAVSFLMEKGIRCLVCGEPLWGTLGDAMNAKGIPTTDQKRLLKELSTEIQTKSPVPHE